MVGPGIELGKAFYLTPHSVWFCNLTVWVKGMSLNETCCKGSTVRYLSDVHRREFSMKQEDVSALFRFKCTLVYGFREAPDN